MRGAQLLLAIMIDGIMLHCNATGYTALQIQHVVANGYTALQIRHVMKALQCIASYIVMHCGAFIVFICVHPILWYIQLFDTSLLCSIHTTTNKKQFNQWNTVFPAQHCDWWYHGKISKDWGQSVIWYPCIFVPTAKIVPLQLE